MTVEDIERILQTVAQNQAKHDEMHSRHSADIAEIDAGFAMLLKSQNRYEERLATISEIMHDLADKHLKNEERFAELATARIGYEARVDQMEASYQLLEQFVRDFRSETNDRFAETGRLFAETDKKLTALASAQAKTDEQMKRTDDRINALVEVQAKTEERINELFNRNGGKPKRGASKTPAKKAAKKARKRG